MTLEDKFKKQLGDLAFSVTVLQHQLEETTNELNAFKTKEATRTQDASAEKTKDVRSTKS